MKKKTIIVECDATFVAFANGDEISYTDDEINMCDLYTTKNGISGYVQAFDLFDYASGDYWCGYELFITLAGHVYPVIQYGLDYDDNDMAFIADMDYLDKCVATMSTHANNIEYWHTIYDAIQSYDNLN